METRILIPKKLQIKFKTAASVPLGDSEACGRLNRENISKKNMKNPGKTLVSSNRVHTGGKQKPTSSSGCGVEDSDTDDSDFETTDVVDSSDEGTDCEGFKISKIWNPSYNLRRPRPGDHESSSESGGSRIEGTQSGEEKVVVRSDTGKSDSGVIVANADSNVQGVADGGRAGHFSQVHLCAARRIESGTVYSPNEGEVAVFFIKDVPSIDTDDIRFIFGCFDRIIHDDDPKGDSSEGESKGEASEPGQIRLCNWIRFLKQAPTDWQRDDPRINCCGRFVDRQAIFEFTRTVPPGEEVVAYFDLKSLTMDGLKKQLGSITTKSTLGQSAPLDLSKSLQVARFHCRSESPESPTDSTASPSPKTGSVNIFPFSIKNVLQPTGKLFQPYNNSNNNNNNNHNRLTPTSRESRTVPGNPSVIQGGIISDRNLLNLSSMGGGLRPVSNLNFQVAPTVRPILRTRGRERSLLPCEVCGKAFDRPSLLKRHMRTHTGEKPHICDVCSKGFSTSSSLNTHRRIHSGEKPHQCPICGKRFTASSNLYYHRMTHNKEKPHKCLLCGKSFPTPGDLKSHQYVHSGSWPYNCPVCHRGFSKQTNLRNHLLLHSGDKPHVCQVCGKKFALACNLRAHLRTHEDEPVSSCISCKRTFLSSLNMLDKGQCRTCIIHQQQNSGGSTTATMLPLIPPPPGTLSGAPLDSKTGDNLALSLGKVGGTPTSGPSSGTPLSAITFPGSSLNESLLASAAGAFPPATTFLPSAAASYLGESMNLLRPNPFLEQLFQWNWRFAKETAGNLGLMQQKLLESQMLAAQLMSVSQNPSIGGSDILKFRL